MPRRQWATALHSRVAATLTALLLGLWSFALPLPVHARNDHAPAAQSADSQGIIVQYRPQTSDAERGALAAALGVSETISRRSIRPDLTLLQPPAGSENKTLSHLRASPHVVYAEPNYRVDPAQTADDPLLQSQWGLAPYDPGFGIDAFPAWDGLVGTALAPALVAVLDTGVAADHPDLLGRLVPGRNTIYGATDLHDTSDENGHGTHVAGIIAAVVNNGIGIAGVAGVADDDGTPAARILPVKVLNAEGAGTVLDVAEGIYWATDQGATIINLSLGTKDYSLTLADAVAYALERGVVVVAAAGNAAGPVEEFYPAALPGVLTVAATTAAGEAADFSNFGPQVDLAAPGQDILSTYPPALGSFDSLPAGYRRLSGTSMAAPFVTGVAALLQGARGSLTAAEVAQILTATAQDLPCSGCLPGRDDLTGHGLVNAYQALLHAGLISQIQFVSPLAGIHIVSTTTVAISVAEPAAVAALEVYLDEATSPFATLFNDGANPALYRFEWSPAAAGVDDGLHTLTAVARDAAGHELGRATHQISVLNPETGLTVHTRAPDGRSAGGAHTSVFLLQRAGQRPEYAKVWSGPADPEGDIRVADGEDMRTGMEFLVTVNGVVPSTAAAHGGGQWFYADLVIDTSSADQRGRQVIDAAAATVPITPAIAAQNSADPDNGTILIRPAAHLDQAGSALTAVAAQWQDPNGPPTFWVRPGDYDLLLQAGTQTESYYLHLPGQTLSAAGNIAFATDGAATLTAQVSLPPATTASVTALDVAIDLPVTSLPLAPPVAEPNSFALADGRPLHITPGDYRLQYQIDLDDRGQPWSYRLRPWEIGGDQEHTFTVAPGAQQITLGHGLNGRMVPTDGDFHPGGSFSFALMALDAQGHLLDEIDTAEPVSVSNLRLQTATGEDVPAALDAAFGEGQYGPAPVGRYVSGRFSAHAPTTGQYRLAADLNVGPLSVTGSLTLVSDLFVMGEAPAAPKPEGDYDLALTVAAPAGSQWQGDVELRLFAVDADSTYTLLWQQTVAGGGATATFTASSPRLSAGKNYHAVVTGRNNTGAVVLYNRPLVPAFEIALAADGLRPVQVRQIDPDGREWTQGHANFDLLVHQSGQHLGTAYQVLTFSDSAANLFVDDGIYDLVLYLSATDGAGIALYTTTAATADRQLTAETAEILFDLTGAPGVTLLSDPAPHQRLSLWVTPAGIARTVTLDTAGSAPVPAYFLPGSYDIGIDYAPGAAAGGLPAGAWSYTLLPAAANAGGKVTLVTGDQHLWTVGGPFSGRLAIGGGATEFYPGQHLPVAAWFSDGYGNTVAGVQATGGQDEVWYDQQQTTSATRPKQARAIAQSSAVLRSYHPGSDGLELVQTTPVGTAGAGNNRPVFVVLGPNGEILRTHDDRFMRDFTWVLPADSAAGEYLARLVLAIDGLTVLHTEQGFSVRDTAGMGLVRGRVSLEGRSAHDGIAVRAVDPAGPIVVAQTVTGPDGAYLLPVPPGSYTVTLARTGWSYVEIDDVAVTADSEVTVPADPALIYGDMNLDGYINVLDLLWMAEAIGTRPGEAGWRPAADHNDDAYINVLDLLAAATNIGRRPATGPGD